MIEITNLDFTFPQSNKKCLNNINLKINKGDFLLLIGESGSSKTTFLKILKKSLSPAGIKTGEILYNGENINTLDKLKCAKEIGYVTQDVDDQIITDRVSSELAFGLESIGISPDEIRRRLAEVSEFLNLKELYEKKTNELSGGEKQIINLASVIALNPKIILLDEPLSQLDQKGSEDFLGVLRKINELLEITIIIAEQKTQDIFEIANRVVLLKDGEIKCDSLTIDAVDYIYNSKEYRDFLPIQTIYAYKKILKCCLSIKETRSLLMHSKNSIKQSHNKKEKYEMKDKIIMNNCYYKYKNNEKDVIKNCSLTIKEGEIISIVGSNGSGKTTLLLLLAGLIKPYRGKIKKNQCYSTVILPQQVRSILINKRVIDEFGSSIEEKNIKELLKKFGISSKENSHPLDISAGEQQRVAIIKVLLKEADLIIFDEPTKNLDNVWKDTFEEELKKLKQDKKTIILVSHDLDFCAQNSDRTAFLFNNQIISIEETRKFFKNNNFYTTATQKITKGIFNDIITKKDLLEI